MLYLAVERETFANVHLALSTGHASARETQVTLECGAFNPTLGEAP